MINLSDPRDGAGCAMLNVSCIHISFRLCYSAIILCELTQWYVKCLTDKPAHAEYLLLGRLDLDVHLLADLCGTHSLEIPVEDSVYLLPPLLGLDGRECCRDQFLHAGLKPACPALPLDPLLHFLAVAG